MGKIWLWLIILIFVFLTIGILVILRLIKKKVISKRQEDAKIVNLTSVLLKNFFKKGEVIYTSLVPGSTDNKRNKRAVMKLIFKREIPKNICLKLMGLSVEVFIGGKTVSFHIIRASSSGNVIMFELEGQDIDSIFKGKHFVKCDRVLIKDSLGEIIYNQ